MKKKPQKMKILPRILKSHDDFKERTYNWLKISEKAMLDYRDQLEAEQ